MPLWLAVVLLIAALTGIALACKYLQKSRPARVLGGVGCVLLALRGIFVLRRSSRLSACLLPPLYMLGLTLAHMLVEVSSRYHYSIIPVIIILAAFALGGSEKSRRSA